jgi:tRNA ligase
MPQDIVDAFAEEWGFIRTRTHVVNSIAEVREFTSHVGETGQWDGEPVEGFVVRTRVTEPPTEGRGTGKHAKSVARGQSPYAPGSSFFFKVKFDEPYMMYRDWREVTKMLLTTKGPLSASILPKSKMKRKETQVYVKWVIEEIKKNRKAFENYTKGKGIIATRERFLRYLESESGKKDVEANGKDESNPQIQGKVEKAIIVPVAIPGCGE